MVENENEEEEKIAFGFEEFNRQMRGIKAVKHSLTTF